MSSPYTLFGTCLALALAAGAPADVNSDLAKAALQAAVPEAGMAESAAHTQVLAALLHHARLNARRPDELL